MYTSGELTIVHFEYSLKPRCLSCELSLLVCLIKWNIKDIINTLPFTYSEMELAWRSGSVMDCHAKARGSIPGGNGVFTELHVLRKGQ